MKLGIENNNTDAIRTAENMFDGNIDAKTAGKVISSVIEQSIEQNGGIMNIMQLIGKIEGRGSSYIGSMESINTAKSVMHMVQGKVTDTDRAIIDRSDGAVTLLTAIEGNKKAWNSVKEAAGRELVTVDTKTINVEGETAIDESHVIVKDGDVFTKDGKKAVISKKSDIVNGVVVNGESKRMKKTDAKGYSVAEKLGNSLKKPVKFVKGLFDAEGNMLDGVETDSGIFINTEGKNPIKWAVTHEFSHTMKKSAAEAWSTYENFVVDKMKRDGSYYTVFEAKAKAYGTRDASYINEEIACDYIGETFDSVDELADFIRKDRGLAVKVRDFYYKALDKLGCLDEKKKAQLMWRDAYREAVLNVKEGKEGKSGEVKYSKTYSFNKQVDDALDYKMKSGFSVYVGKLPNLLSKCGLNPELDMLINQGHLRNINHEKDGLHDEYHGIPREIIKQAPELLKWPAAIYDSISEKNKENSVCVLTNKCDKDGNPIIIIIENSDRESSYLNLKFDTVNVKASNYIKSIYGRTGFFTHMNDVIDKDSVLYVSKNGMEKLFTEIEKLNAKNKKPELNSDSKLQLLTRLDNLGFDNIIHQSRNVVNTYSMQNGEKDAKKSISGTRLSEVDSAPAGESADSSSEETSQKFIKPGAEPRRDVKVPESVKEGTKVRQFARTAAEAETLTDKTSEGVLENVEKGKFNYTPISDKSAMNNAYATLDTMGVEWVEKKVSGAISSHSLDKKTVAMAEVLMQRYSEEGQHEKVQKLIVDFAAESTRTAQSLQAISMLKKLDPNYEVSYIDKVVENLREEIIEKNMIFHYKLKKYINYAGRPLTGNI